jgi:hypothetical protein
MLSNLALASVRASVALRFAAPAASLAWLADCCAAWAFWSTSVIRPSFLRVRSWVYSSDRPIESTLSFTSPTLVRTNFLVAHAVEPPMARTTTGTATKNFRNMTILLKRRA